MPTNNSWVTYIPGFKEPLSPNQPGKIIELLAEDTWKSFQRMILPWDPRYDRNSKFSLSAVRERTSELLESIPMNTTLVTYSLSALPVFWAINDKIDLVRDRVSKVVFLNPADNPVYSVAVMDWILWRWKWDVKPLEEYLDWPTWEVFNRLIDGWIGDWDQFQKDLQDIYKSHIDLTAMLTTLNIKFSIIDWDDDAVTRRRVMQNGEVKFTQAMRSHIPDLTNQRFIY